MEREILRLPHHRYVIDDTAMVNTEQALADCEARDYLEYWGLDEKPFENTSDPDYFYESYDHIEALERLFYLVEEGNMNFGMLTGEIGCGKTITRSVFISRLSPVRYEVIDMENSNLPFKYILFEIIQRMSSGDINKRMGEYDLYYLLKEFRELLEAKVARRRRKLVIILDEAQQLSKESIIELKNLTNITFDNQSCITVVFMGQPELRGAVKTLPQIDQRISLRYHLSPLSEKDIDGYLHHRLMVGGHPDGSLFLPAAVRFLCQSTGGIPREINRICKLALDRAFSLRLDHIDENVINSITMDLHKQDGKNYG
jgi:general secretion pathway protein A